MFGQLGRDFGLWHGREGRESRMREREEGERAGVERGDGE